MAEVHWTRVASEKIEAGNNHWTRAQFYAQAPDLDWRAFFSAAGLGGQNDFVVWQPSALIGLSKLVGERVARHLEGLFEVSCARGCRALFAQTLRR